MPSRTELSLVPSQANSLHIILEGLKTVAKLPFNLAWELINIIQDLVFLLNCNKALTTFWVLISQYATAINGVREIQQTLHLIEESNKGVQNCSTYPNNYLKFTLCFAILETAINAMEARSYFKHMGQHPLQSNTLKWLRDTIKHCIRKCNGRCGSRCCESVTLSEEESEITLLLPTQNIQMPTAPCGIGLQSVLTIAGALVRGSQSSAAMLNATSSIISAKTFTPCTLRTNFFITSGTLGFLSALYKGLFVLLDTTKIFDGTRFLQLIRRISTESFGLEITQFIYSNIRYSPFFIEKIASFWNEIQILKTLGKDTTGAYKNFFLMISWAMLGILAMTHTGLKITRKNIAEIADNQHQSCLNRLVTHPYISWVDRPVKMFAAAFFAENLGRSVATITTTELSDSDYFLGAYVLIFVAIFIMTFLRFID